MGCCGWAIQTPKFEVWINNVLTSEIISNSNLAQLLEVYDSLSEKPKTIPGILRKLYTFPPLDQDNKQETTEEQKITENIWCFNFPESKAKKEVKNPKLFILEFCAFFAPEDLKTTKRDIIAKVLKEENEFNLEYFDEFLKNSIEYSFFTLIDNTHQYCFDNKGKSIFGICIDDDFMNEFDKVMDKCITKSNVTNFIKKCQVFSRGTFGEDNIAFSEDNIDNVDQYWNNTLFIYYDLHSEFYTRYMDIDNFES